VTVQRIEKFALAAVGVDYQRPVGQNAVNVQSQQFYFRQINHSKIKIEDLRHSHILRATQYQNFIEIATILWPTRPVALKNGKNSNTCTDKPLFT
jgi:hypothetical protein